MEGIHLVLGQDSFLHHYGSLIAEIEHWFSTRWEVSLVYILLGAISFADLLEKIMWLMVMMIL